MDKTEKVLFTLQIILFLLVSFLSVWIFITDVLHLPYFSHWICGLFCLLILFVAFWINQILSKVRLILKETEIRYQQLFENIHCGIAVYQVIENGKDFIFKDFNKAAERIDHDDKSRLIGKSIFEVRPGAESFGLIDVFRKVWTTGKPMHHPVHFYKDNVLSGWYENYVYRLPDNEIVAVFEDVTERKNQEFTLKENEKNLRNSQRVAHVGHWVLDVRKDQVAWSEEMKQIFGIDPQDFGGNLGLIIRKTVHPDDIEKVLESACQRKLVPLEYRLVLPNQEIRYVYTVPGEPECDAEGKMVKLSGIVQDITERKKAELSEIKMRKILQTLWNLATKQKESIDDLCTFVLEEIKDITSSAYAFYGTVTEELELMQIFSWSKDAMKECRIQNKVIEYPLSKAGLWGDAVRKRQTIVVNNYWDSIPGKKGLPIGHVPLTRFISMPVFAKGKIIAVAAVANKKSDYTQEDIKYLEFFLSNAIIVIEHKRLETALHEEKERLDVTLRSIGDGVITTDMEGKVLFLNKAAETLTGWQTEEAKGKLLPEVFSIIHEITRQVCTNPVEKVLQRDAPAELANHTLLLTKSGQERIIADSAAPVRDQNGKTIGVVLVFRDITEEQRLLEHAQRTDKLESLGIVVGGIAHDFNNLLCGLFGYIEMAKTSLDERTKSEEYLEKALASFRKAKDLTQQFLTFSKGNAPARKTGDLSAVLKENTLFALSGSTVAYSFDIAEDLWLCDFDEFQISQMINNIVINAVHAMPHDGQLIISASNMHKKNTESWTLESGDYLRVSFKDNGTGIEPAHLSRIFDPFFTTKPCGHGLGLTIAYSIVKKHGGDIQVETALGSGTAFIIWLPRSHSKSPAATAEIPKQHRGTGRILVMDDDASIRETVGSMLQDMGYQPEYAINGEQACAMIRESENQKQPYCAVIMDLTVRGGMGGKEAAAVIRTINKSMILIVSSGYSDDPVLSDPLKYGFTQKITKPFRKRDLEDLFDSLFHTPNISDKE